MSALIVLIGLSLLVAIIFLVAFIMSVSKGQFDDTHTPGVRILFDDGVKKEEPKDPASQDAKEKK